MTTLSKHLGKKSDYVDRYDVALLQPISRDTGRKSISACGNAIPFFDGFDLWTGFEMSWLNTKGKPVVGIAEFRIPAKSKNLIESKSFKLYLNSLNQSNFDSAEQLQSILTADLSEAAQGNVSVSLFAGLTDYCRKISDLSGICIDDLDIQIDDYGFNPALLQGAVTENSPFVREELSSNLLKSNCLVTMQPDWGSVLIKYEGRKIDREKLLRYIISFRQHNEFHEQCVERIFSDIKNLCQPEKLTVFARYTRRGGLDINPFRSDYEIDSDMGRLIRQ